MPKAKIFLASAFIFLLGQISQAQVVLSDEVLAKMAAEENPTTLGMTAQVEQSKSTQSLTQSQFDPKLSASYSYQSSNEDAIFEFIPVWRPQKNLKVGLAQKISYGMKVNTEIFANQLTSADGFVTDATQVGALVGLELDIWKNFLGRLDKKDLTNQELGRKIAELQGKTNKRGFVLDVRKIYWTLVATELSLNLSQSLVKTAKNQLRDAKRRANDGAGDSSDISRNQAQVSARESAALFFSYQKENLLAQLKSLLPDLETKTLSINTNERKSMDVKTRQCLGQIAQEKEMKSQYSDYPEIVSMLEEQKRNSVALAKATDSMDVKLQASYQASGVSDSHGKAVERFTDEFKNGYAVGVAVNVPLGGDLTKARESQVIATHHRISSQKEGLRLKLSAEHQKAQKALKLLSQASASQRKTISNLKKSMKSSQRKYRQARISLNTLILEQDNYFNAELQNIETQRQILEFLFDYFKIFPKHPCSANTATGAIS